MKKVSTFFRDSILLDFRIDSFTHMLIPLFALLASRTLLSSSIKE